MLRRSLTTVVLVAAAVLAGCTLPTAKPSQQARAQDKLVHLNEIQSIGSHNSYHVEAPPAESDLRRSFIGDEEDALLYDHVGLTQQFATQGVRQIELDIFRDDEGGKYANPLLRQAVNGGPYDPAMNEPGTKVLHVQDVDYHTTCLTLVECLAEVVAFSADHPNHVPIAVLLELKDTPLDLGGFPFVVPDPWDGPAMDRLDEEILSVVPRDQLLLPDDVRGSFTTLDEAVTTAGWPTLAESRGKLILLMDNSGGYRSDYLNGHPTLEDRVLFTNADPGDADAAFIKRNDPIGSQADIIDLVGQGYVVRTRADADTEQARSGDTTMRDAALASGAQWVSTDYPALGPRYAARWGTDYVVRITDGRWIRCNPVVAVAGCQNALLE